MELLLIIIVLVLEICYYSLFMKFVKNENKLSKYFLSFLIFTIISLFLNSNSTTVMILLPIIILGILKLVIGKEIKIYDFILIFFMFIFKILIETSFYIILNNITKYVYLNIIVNIAKIGTLYILRNKFNNIYNNFVKSWNSNNFYTRYVSSILMILYFIITFVLIIMIGWK